ncbi:MAG: molecular chaperone DnaJ, partial [Acaryochloridaceae cyanobacterium RU_4_10]|nr:molecular chaperone DnaJ [Acaryochloridaceae cyanobacterium RU_4_10]
LKFDTYRQLEDLIKRRSLPRAIAIVEALQARLPNDPEVRQWQALIYQQWGRQLIQERKLNQARAYLKKALKTDPHNKSLWTEVNNDFRRMETHL